MKILIENNLYNITKKEFDKLEDLYLENKDEEINNYLREIEKNHVSKNRAYFYHYI